MKSQETTLYVVAYDISDDRRRTQIHKLLCGYGDWTQYSLFECWLTRQHLIELRAKLKKVLRSGGSLRFYPLCKSCVARVETVGSPHPAEPLTIILQVSSVARFTGTPLFISEHPNPVSASR